MYLVVARTPARAAEDTPADAFALNSIAQHAVIMDYETGALMFSKDGDVEMAPASMAKLMTVAIIFQKLKHKELRLEDTFTVSERAWRLSVAGKNESSKMFVSIGSQIKVEDLLRGIIIQSGNDACTVVAEHFSGGEEAFAELMNAEARRIGMKNSVFRNASGLPDPGMHVTAHDLAILAAYLIREYPEYYHYFSEREFTWNGIRQANRNLLLGTYNGADGLKTGHTAASGYGLVASAVQEGRRLIVVVNGLKNETERAAESKRMLDIGFREFKPYELFAKGSVIENAPVWGGAQDVVPLVPADKLRVLLRRHQRDSMKVVLSYDAPLPAPVKKGQVIGNLKVTATGMPEMTIPVAAGADVEEGGFFSMIERGVRGLVSDTAEPQKVSRDVPVEDTQTAGTPSPEPASAP
jgi:D-alanyl-D-alanine carboxypeptidase (penicillin-binding protein 5/6)